MTHCAYKSWQDETQVHLSVCLPAMHRQHSERFELLVTDPEIFSRFLELSLVQKLTYMFVCNAGFKTYVPFQKAGLQDGGRFSRCVDLGLLYLPVDAGWF